MADHRFAPPQPLIRIDIPPNLVWNERSQRKPAFKQGRRSSKASLDDKRGRGVLPVRLIGRDDEDALGAGQADVE